MIPGLDPDAMAGRLNAAGAPYGIEFGRRETVANSRLALEAAEFARDHGRYDELHGQLFAAYFQEGRNIGELETVLQVAGGAGLDTAALRQALARGVYRERLDVAREQGRACQVTGLPTFILNGAAKIVGAQRYDVFAGAVGQFL